MPSKSRHGRRKLHRSKKRRKGTPISPAMAAQQQVVAQPDKSVVPPKVAAPSAGAPTLTLARYPYIVTELRRIGILAGIILVILVVLFLVLP